jgi:hypothetical protein
MADIFNTQFPMSKEKDTSNYPFLSRNSSKVSDSLSYNKKLIDAVLAPKQEPVMSRQEPLMSKQIPATSSTQFQLPSGYEKISGALYPTAEAQKSAYSDIRTDPTGAYLYGRPTRQVMSKEVINPPRLMSKEVSSIPRIPEQKASVSDSLSYNKKLIDAVVPSMTNKKITIKDLAEPAKQTEKPSNFWDTISGIPSRLNEMNLDFQRRNLAKTEEQRTELGEQRMEDKMEERIKSLPTGETLSARKKLPYMQGEELVIKKENQIKDSIDNLKIGWEVFKKDTKGYFTNVLPGLLRDAVNLEADRQIPLGVDPKVREDVLSSVRVNYDEGIIRAREKYEKDKANFEQYKLDHPELFLSSHEGYSWGSSALETIENNPKVLQDPGFYVNEAAKSAAFMGTALTSGILSSMTTGTPVPGVMLATTPALSNSLAEEAAVSGATPEQQALIGGVGGPILALVEVVGELTVINSFVKGFKKSFSKNLVKETIETIYDKILRYAKTFTKIELGEVLEENIQEIVTNTAIRTVDENRSIIEGLKETTVGTAIATVPMSVLGLGAESYGRSFGKAAVEAKEEKEKTGVYPIPLPFAATIKDVSDSRLEEVKKFNSADEYVKSKEIVYHGSNEEFTEFDESKTGGAGFFFYKNKTDASSIGDNVKEVSLDIKNPAPENVVKKISDKTTGGNPQKQLVDELKSLGYDAIIKPNEVVVFDKSQIKTIS